MHCFAVKDVCSRLVGVRGGGGGMVIEESSPKHIEITMGKSKNCSYVGDTEVVTTPAPLYRNFDCTPSIALMCKL